MQDNLKLIIWTLAGLVAAWFITMAVSRNIFLHTDVDRSLTGVVSIAKTDIGTQCGEEYVNSNALIEYKLNSSNQIVYLCPQGWSPIQKTVMAGNLGDDFRAQINPLQRNKLNKYYPGTEKPAAPINSTLASPAAAPVQAPQQPAAVTPAAAPDQQGALDAPPPIQPVREKGLFAPPAPPAQQTAPAPTPPAKPAAPDNANPFLGNPAPAAAPTAAPAAPAAQ